MSKRQAPRRALAGDNVQRLEPADVALVQRLPRTDAHRDHLTTLSRLINRSRADPRRIAARRRPELLEQLVHQRPR